MAATPLLLPQDVLWVLLGRHAHPSNGGWSCQLGPARGWPCVSDCAESRSTLRDWLSRDSDGIACEQA